MSYIFLESETKFRFEVTGLNNYQSCLIIDRENGEIFKEPPLEHHDDHVVKAVDGILGLIKLKQDQYLILCTESKLVGQIQGKKIYKIVETEVIPLNPKTKLVGDEKRYLAMLKNALNCNSLYWSKHYDLTQNAQKIADDQVDLKRSERPRHERADPRFYWNKFIASPFVEAGMQRWTLVVMNGFVHIESTQLNGRSLDFALISRRSRMRTGKRFACRGLDMEGHAANFAETEQAIFVRKQSESSVYKVASYVQTRGSIPLCWRQPVTLKYAPKILIEEDDNRTSLAFRRHFETQVALYGKQVLLNLVNHKMPELELEQAFADQVESASNPCLRFVSFDFHHECKGMAFHNISRLVKRVRDEFSEMGYYASDDKVEGKTLMRRTVRRQTGVFRTNCMDCLDRTNVVQSVIARRVLQDQLLQLDVLEQEDVFTAHPDRPDRKARRTEFLDAKFERMFKNTWADNADAMSIQYSGTGALKTDFTRTGKRSIR